MSLDALQQAVSENPSMQVTLRGSDLLGMIDTMRTGLVSELRSTMTEVVMEARREMLSGVHALHHEKTMTVNEVCTMLSVDRSTLRRWDKCGFLVANKIGGKVLYNPKDVLEVLNKRKQLKKQ